MSSARSDLGVSSPPGLAEEIDLSAPRLNRWQAGALAALSVALLFYSWRSLTQKNEQQHDQLRERVTYMLWVMANSVPGCK